MWEYPKSQLHQAAIDAMKPERDREAARAVAFKLKHSRQQDAAQASRITKRHGCDSAKTQRCGRHAWHYSRQSPRRRNNAQAFVTALCRLSKANCLAAHGAANSSARSARRCRLMGNFRAYPALEQGDRASPTMPFAALRPRGLDLSLAGWADNNEISRRQLRQCQHQHVASRTEFGVRRTWHKPRSQEMRGGGIAHFKLREDRQTDLNKLKSYAIERFECSP